MNVSIIAGLAITTTYLIYLLSARPSPKEAFQMFIKIALGGVVIMVVTAFAVVGFENWL